MSNADLIARARALREELKPVAPWACGSIRELIEAIEAAEIKLGKARDALDYYANDDFYQPYSKMLSGSVKDTVIDVLEDSGNRAIETLAEIDK